MFGTLTRGERQGLHSELETAYWRSLGYEASQGGRDLRLFEPTFAQVAMAKELGTLLTELSPCPHCASASSYGYDA